MVVPKSAVVDFENKRGVWMPNGERRAVFAPVTLGIEGPERVEILSGLKEGDRFVNAGAGAVRNNDQLIIAGEMNGDGPSGAGGSRFQGGQRPNAKGSAGGERKRPQGQ
jgi:hypothetical protein